MVRAHSVGHTQLQGKLGNVSSCAQVEKVLASRDRHESVFARLISFLYFVSSPGDSLASSQKRMSWDIWPRWQTRTLNPSCLIRNKMAIILRKTQQLCHFKRNKQMICYYPNEWLCAGGSGNKSFVWKEGKKDETFFLKNTSTSRHFIALTPYEFQAVFLNEFTNCCGGMGVGGNGVVCTRTWNMNAESRNVCPSVQGQYLWQFESKRQRSIGASVPLFIGPWSFAAVLLNQTKDICTYFVEKEKEIKFEHSENC